MASNPPAQDLSAFNSLVTSPRSSFAERGSKSFEAMIWSHQISQADLRSSITLAHRGLVRTVCDLIAAHNREASKLREVLQAWGETTGESLVGNTEALTSTLVVKVKQRWSYDERLAQVRQAEILANLKDLIASPSSSFTPDNTLEKQIWSDEELSPRLLRAGLRHAHRELEVAITRQLAAHEEEVRKLRELLQRGGEKLQAMQAKDKDVMKGNLCVIVHQRWSFEKQTTEMVGEVPRVRIMEGVLGGQTPSANRFLPVN
ncbi:hypothetical protein PRZ48_001662 [Zasmidium cellare]|uniref:Uncharacterized protein n=1 Tax=Zasmidium cellare TaxID=395010 RepID=A0ABR0F1V3_ZASCE|nr:hypothetical protein PRZ48_001662 [Zasmidium cellare]